MYYVISNYNYFYIFFLNHLSKRNRYRIHVFLTKRLKGKLAIVDRFRGPLFEQIGRVFAFRNTCHAYALKKMPVLTC